MMYSSARPKAFGSGDSLRFARVSRRASSPPLVVIRIDARAEASPHLFTYNQGSLDNSQLQPPHSGVIGGIFLGIAIGFHIVMLIPQVRRSACATIPYLFSPAIYRLCMSRGSHSIFSCTFQFLLRQTFLFFADAV